MIYKPQILTTDASRESLHNSYQSFIHLFICSIGNTEPGSGDNKDIENREPTFHESTVHLGDRHKTNTAFFQAVGRSGMGS